MRSRLRMTALVFGLILTLPAGVTVAAETDIQLFGKPVGTENAYACYIRKYSKAHLASHPDQNVRDMMVLVDSHMDEEGAGRQYILGMTVNFRYLKQTFSTYGGCSAGSDGKQALHCGIDCDGGTIGVRIKDEKSILIDIPYGARVAEDYFEEERSGLPQGAKFGSDDKLFRLDRTDLSSCLPLANSDEAKAALAAH